MLLMADALVVAYTVAFEEVEDGWVMATILEKPGAISQGRNRAEARENVRDAPRDPSSRSRRSPRRFLTSDWMSASVRPVAPAARSPAMA